MTKSVILRNHLGKLNLDDQATRYAVYNAMEEYAEQETNSNKLKKFALTTHSESGDHYLYFIEHLTEPTQDELQSFLNIHGSDVDEDGQCYEYIQECIEIEKYYTIPLANENTKG